ncbi:hypothetical protein [Yersinia aldovae]|jgi:pilus assembly protein CpaB|uniref:hypothetical protein n=1 Tax=Yersinia aldovae TaxID=29483 RepID=UPI0005ACDBF3|nr:hypothetical protein [Yersinia aldovae]AJJ63795.1 putative tight adherance operon protein [Yersinia aldovae 670-83]
MNRKFLLLFSLLIVAIGATGILINIGDDKDIPNGFVDMKKEKEVSIVLAQSTHDIASGTLLTQDDYSLKTIIVPESSTLIRSDISNSTNINNNLLKSNLLAGSYITKDLLVSPDSDEFLRLNLSKGDVIYKFNIKQHNEYLLDTLQVGDVLAFQLRLLETDKKSGMDNGISINTKDINDRKNQIYSLNKIIPAMRIVRIKKYLEDELSEKNKKNQKTGELLTGFIEVIVKRDELDIIHITEKSGDTFLTPSSNDEKNKIINLYDVIPKLRTTRELRG